MTCSLIRVVSQEWDYCVTYTFPSFIVGKLLTREKWLAENSEEHNSHHVITRFVAEVF